MTLPSGVDPLRHVDPLSLGRFRLLGRIGAGGMGVVFLGEDSDGVVAAVKTIRHELADDQGFRDRFFRELHASFRVSGACTVRLLDFDVTDDPPWLATEYVDAPNLEQLVSAGGPLGESAQLALALGLADALVTLHAKGIIHRDLKPSNVLCPDDGVKVIDFGIASAGNARSLTGTSQVIGTPAWMAPERFSGGKATPAADVFAWAGLVSFAACGWVPFSGDSARVMFSILRGEAAVDYDLLAQPLRDLVVAAFAVDPQQRPSARQLRDELMGGLQSLVVVPGPDAVTEQLTQLLPAGWDGAPDPEEEAEQADDREDVPRATEPLPVPVPASDTPVEEPALALEPSFGGVDPQPPDTAPDGIDERPFSPERPAVPPLMGRRVDRPTARPRRARRRRVVLALLSLLLVGGGVSWLVAASHSFRAEAPVRSPSLSQTLSLASSPPSSAASGADFAGGSARSG